MSVLLQSPHSPHLSFPAHLCTPGSHYPHQSLIHTPARILCFSASSWLLLCWLLALSFCFLTTIVCTFSWTYTCLPVSGCELLHQWITKIILLLSSVSIWVQFFISWVWQMYYETHCQPFFDLFPHKWVLFLTTGVSHAERTLYLRLPVMPEPTWHFDFSLMTHFKCIINYSDLSKSLGTVNVLTINN